MTSKEIIVKLIDNHTLTGEEAYILMNDVLKGEMVVVNETLKDKSGWPYTGGISSVGTYGISGSPTAVTTTTY